MSQETFIPNRDHDFHVMQTRVSKLAKLNENRWGLDSSWLYDPFDTAKTVWDSSYEAYLEPTTRTAIITAAKNTARKKYEPLLRMLISGLKVNPRVTETDREELGLSSQDRKPTPAPVPVTVPAVDIRYPAPGRVELHYFDSGNTESKKRAKPAGVHGVEIRNAVLDENPGNDWSKLTQSAFDTATPYVFSFEGTERGKRLYFAMRWENTRGEKGPLSNIYEAIIP